jgi:coproporphyrinogen III oxidase
MIRFETILRESQLTIIKELEFLFQDHFMNDYWESSLGKGNSAICQGKLLEKGGVNISFIEGASLPKAATKKRKDLEGTPFQACGLSLVVHPFNPKVPTVHFNIRKISCLTKNIQWFGGGYDLTPYIPSLENSHLWHRQTQKFLDKYSDTLYSSWAKNCDEYFYLPHRQEPRGIGGIFFDDFLLEGDVKRTEEMLKNLTDQFLELYKTIVISQIDKPFTSKEKEFQLLRRGRYVEFNLVYDRGTHFGLQSGGRAESILMSLPKNVSWIYAGDDKFKSENKILESHWKEIKSYSQNLRLLK